MFDRLLEFESIVGGHIPRWRPEMKSFQMTFMARRLDFYKLGIHSG